MSAIHIDHHTHLACDIGSNAIRILLGKAQSNGAQIRVQKQSFIRLPVRLGGDVFADGAISVPHIDHIVEVCHLIRSLENLYHAASVQICATSAMRESTNCQQVVDAVFERGGYKIDVIDGDEEANLVQLVVRHFGLQAHAEQLFIDLGGGSIELVHFVDNQPHLRRSFKVGTVRTLLDKVPAGEWDTLEQWLHSWLKQQSIPSLIGTGGTINTLVKIVGQPGGDRIALNDMQAFVAEAEPLALSIRQTRWNLREDKADVIVLGCAIYCRIMQILGAEHILVPKVGLSDALVLRKALGLG